MFSIWVLGTLLSAKKTQGCNSKGTQPDLRQTSKGVEILIVPLKTSHFGGKSIDLKTKETRAQEVEAWRSKYPNVAPIGTFKAPKVAREGSTCHFSVILVSRQVKPCFTAPLHHPPARYSKFPWSCTAYERALRRSPNHDSGVHV